MNKLNLEIHFLSLDILRLSTLRICLLQIEHVFQVVTAHAKIENYLQLFWRWRALSFLTLNSLLFGLEIQLLCWDLFFRVTCQTVQYNQHTEYSRFSTSSPRATSHTHCLPPKLSLRNALLLKKLDWHLDWKWTLIFSSDH